MPEFKQNQSRIRFELAKYCGPLFYGHIKKTFHTEMLFSEKSTSGKTEEG